jgi:synaptobrevin family protein YKT6
LEKQSDPPKQHKTIESVLERGEKLDSLVDRSNALSAQSKMFYKSAKKVGPLTASLI